MSDATVRSLSTIPEPAQPHQSMVTTRVLDPPAAAAVASR
jgi:hypothetical protein